MSSYSSPFCDASRRSLARSASRRRIEITREASARFLMTVDLGGFNSTSMSGLNLVIIGVNFLMPWRAAHTAINALIILGMYVTFDLVAGLPFDQAKITNDFFFLIATAVLAVRISIICATISSRRVLPPREAEKARDALWGEMELAERDPDRPSPPEEGEMHTLESAVTMLPAKGSQQDY